MKIASGIISAVFSAVMLILAVVLFASPTGNYEMDKAYGGDAYTGIQNAAAQTANNVQRTNEIMSTGFGAIALGSSFGFAILSLRSFQKSASDEWAAKQLEKAKKIEYPSQPVAQPTPQPAVEQKTWICSCGFKNTESSSMCKGCSATRPTKVTFNEYIKCSCGAMVQPGVCPLCGADVR